MLIKRAPVWVVIIASFVLGLYRLDAYPFWQDELSTWRVITSVTMSKMLWKMTGDNHLPLYFVILKFLRDLFNLGSEWALRFPSVCFYALGNALLVKQSLNRSSFKWLSWFVVLLTLTHQGLIDWAQEFRPYAFSYAVIVCYLCFLQDFLQDRRSVKGLFVVGVVALYSHYFAALIVFLSLLAAVYFHRQKLKHLVALSLSLLACFLPWHLISFKPILSPRYDFLWVEPLSPSQLHENLAFVLNGPFITWFILISLSGLLIRAQWKNWMFPLSVLLLAFLIVSLKSWISYSVMEKRYFIVLVPFFIWSLHELLELLTKEEPIWGKVFAASVILLSLSSWVFKTPYGEGFQRTDLALKEFKSQIKQFPAGKQPVLLGVSYNSHLFRYYLSKDPEFAQLDYRMEWRAPCFKHPFLKEQLRTIQERSVWILYFTHDCPDFAFQAKKNGVGLNYLNDFSGTSLVRIDSLE